MMKKAAPHVKFMHCLPAIVVKKSVIVIDSDLSIVIDEAENN